MYNRKNIKSTCAIDPTVAMLKQGEMINNEKKIIFMTLMNQTYSYSFENTSNTLRTIARKACSKHCEIFSAHHKLTTETFQSLAT